MMTPVNSTSEVKESKSVQPSSIYPIVVSAQPLQPQLISANPNPNE